MNRIFVLSCILQSQYQHSKYNGRKEAHQQTYPDSYSTQFKKSSKLFYDTVCVRNICAALRCISFILNTKHSYCSGQPDPQHTYDRVYMTGQAIGDSFKFDLWKARHRNVHILGDSGPFMLLLTYVRDKTVAGEEFSKYADSLMRFLLMHAFAILPRQNRAIVTTTKGHQVQGVKLQPNLDLVAFMVTTTSHPDGMKPFANLLMDCFPGASVGELAISWPDSWEPDVVWRWHTPSPKKRVLRLKGLQMEGCHAVLFSPVIATGRSTEVALKKMQAAGLEVKNIVLVTLVTSLEGLTFLAEQYPTLKFVVGEVDPEIDEKGSTVPGMGDFIGRYMGEKQKGWKRLEELKTGEK